MTSTSESGRKSARMADPKMRISGSRAASPQPARRNSCQNWCAVLRRNAYQFSPTRKSREFSVRMYSPGLLARAGSASTDMAVRRIGMPWGSRTADA